MRSREACTTQLTDNGDDVWCNVLHVDSTLPRSHSLLQPHITHPYPCACAPTACRQEAARLCPLLLKSASQLCSAAATATDTGAAGAAHGQQLPSNTTTSTTSSPAALQGVLAVLLDWLQQAPTQGHIRQVRQVHDRARLGTATAAQQRLPVSPRGIPLRLHSMRGGAREGRRYVTSHDNPHPHSLAAAMVSH